MGEKTKKVNMGGAQGNKFRKQGKCVKPGRGGGEGKPDACSQRQKVVRGQGRKIGALGGTWTRTQ